eukprot:528968_1
MQSDQEEKKEEINLPKELLAPPLEMSSILVNNIDIKDNEEIDKITDHVYPSQIIDDWLYLGSAYHARDLHILKKLGITHVLNVTNNVKNYFGGQFIYAQLPLNDIGNDAIYNYFEATKEFINQCNPSFGNEDKKIFVHCAVGMSRSATIIIAYLISNYVELKQTDQNRLDFIKHKLPTITHEFNENMIQFMNSYPLLNKYSKIEEELNDVQIEMLKQYRLKYNGSKGMKLNEAYYYVKSCRQLISPNTGFCGQLRRYEKLYHNESTLCDIEKFTLIDNNTDLIWKEASSKYPNKINVNNANNRGNKLINCIVL